MLVYIQVYNESKPRLSSVAQWLVISVGCGPKGAHGFRSWGHKGRSKSNRLRYQSESTKIGDYPEDSPTTSVRTPKNHRVTLGRQPDLKGPIRDCSSEGYRQARGHRDAHKPKGGEAVTCEGTEQCTKF